MAKTNNEPIFSVKLTVAELFVLAAMLGYNTVCGVSERPFADRKNQPEKTVGTVKSALEKKGFISYGFDGTLYVRKLLKVGISAVGNSDNIISICSNAENGKRQTIYVFKSDGHFVTLRKARLSETYTLNVRMADVSAEVPYIGKGCNNSCPCKFAFEIPLDEIRQAKKSSMDFSNVVMTETLNKYCSADVANSLAKAFDSAQPYLTIKLFCKSGSEYRTDFSGTYILSHNPFSIYINNEKLYVKAENIVNVCNKVLNAL